MKKRVIKILGFILSTFVVLMSLWVAVILSDVYPGSYDVRVPLPATYKNHGNLYGYERDCEYVYWRVEASVDVEHWAELQQHYTEKWNQVAIPVANAIDDMSFETGDSYALFFWTNGKHTVTVNKRVMSQDAKENPLMYNVVTKIELCSKGE